MINGTTEGEDIILVNSYAPNVAAHKYIKQLLMDMKEEINGNTVRIRNFNNPHTTMDRVAREKINNETMALNDMLDQIGLTDI